MPTKNAKTPTEPLTFNDVWNGFKVDYLPFVEWMSNPDDDFSFIIVEFAENDPLKYKNKWGREQFKIRVNQNEEEKMLSAGVKLFVKLKNFCIKENLMPKDLGKVQIDRYGSGFDTDYSIKKSTN